MVKQLNKTEIIFIRDTDNMPNEAVNEKKVLTEQLYEKIFENTGAATVTIKPDTVPKNSEFSYQNKNGDIRFAFMTGSSLIDNVLDISRIESGTFKQKITEFLLNVQMEEI